MLRGGKRIPSDTKSHSQGTGGNRRRFLAASWLLHGGGFTASNNARDQLAVLPLKVNTAQKHKLTDVRLNVQAESSTDHRRLITFYRATLCFRGICYCLLCLSVRLSVTNGGIETTGRIELIFGTEASFHLSHTVVQGKLGISKNYGTFLWNFVPNSGLRKFRHSKSIAFSNKLVVADSRTC